MINLDSLKQEYNLRKAWPNEAKDFTPWSLEPLDLIGNILEMYLKLVETELTVDGIYSAVFPKIQKGLVREKNIPITKYFYTIKLKLLNLLHSQITYF